MEKGSQYDTKVSGWGIGAMLTEVGITGWGEGWDLEREW